MLLDEGVVPVGHRPLGRVVGVFNFVIGLPKLHAEALRAVVVIPEDDVKGHVDGGIRQLKFVLELRVIGPADPRRINVVTEVEGEVTPALRAHRGEGRSDVELRLLAGSTVSERDKTHRFLDRRVPVIGIPR
jgi:hypothetical protein